MNMEAGGSWGKAGLYTGSGGWYRLNHIILEIRHEIKKTGQKEHFAASDHFSDHE